MRKNGELFWNDLSITPVRDEHGDTTHFIGVIMDVTATKQRTAHLEHEVNHDPLTGLANRNLLWDRLEQALHMAHRQKSMIAILLIDLNNFKNINDTYGHEAGDMVLKVVARRLQASVRDSDTVARLSGDEFVLVLVNQPSLRFTLRMIERLRQGLTQPVSFMHKEIEVGASLGVAVYPHDGLTSADLVRSADVAMYHAKATGRNEIYFFSNDMKSTTEARQRFDAGMSHAIERDELFMLYQPCIDARSGKVASFEALLRWRHPEQGVLLPSAFLPEAEENGRIVEFGAWVLDQACAFLRDLKELGVTDVPVTVNISAREYGQHDFVANIAARLKAFGLPPESLQIELREETLIRNPGQVRDLAKQLRQLGLTLSIDEFGQGMTRPGLPARAVRGPAETVEGSRARDRCRGTRRRRQHDGAHPDRDRAQPQDAGHWRCGRNPGAARFPDLAWVRGAAGAAAERADCCRGGEGSGAGQDAGLSGAVACGVIGVHDPRGLESPPYGHPGRDLAASAARRVGTVPTRIQGTITRTGNSPTNCDYPSLVIRCTNAPSTSSAIALSTWQVPAFSCPPPPYSSIRLPIFVFDERFRIDLPVANTVFWFFSPHNTWIEIFVSGNSA